jgi:hypothetical protein
MGKRKRVRTTALWMPTTDLTLAEIEAARVDQQPLEDVSRDRVCRIPPVCIFGCLSAAI